MKVMCANHSHFIPGSGSLASLSCKYKFGGLYPPSCENVSQSPVMISFAKRPQKEPERMLFAGNLLIIKIGWHTVGLGWLDIPASHRRWPPGAFQWPVELTPPPCTSLLDFSSTFSLSIPAALKFTSCIQIFKEWQFAILPSDPSGWFSELLGVTERLSSTPRPVKSHRLLQSGSCAGKLYSASFKWNFSPVFPWICLMLVIQQML